jgi:5-methylcytosine-specific restriction enzyme subunit McrC
MKIPIQNIYYLLCYAWDKLDEGDIVEVKGIESTELCDLFAKVLISGTSHLLKMGLDRGYLLIGEEISGIKGKIDFSSSLKDNLLKKARAYCLFDELDHNILHNQILKSTLLKLALVDELDDTLRASLYNLLRRLSEINEIHLSQAVFRKVQLNHNNAFYDFLLKICELVIDNLLPTQERGRSKFRNFLEDEKQMSTLFESFVRNFYRLEQKTYKVGREDIQWDISGDDRRLLPKMQTDISLESDDKKIIIDTKYYSEALSEHYGVKKIREPNLYQIFAYLKNIEKKNEKDKFSTGILLYPYVDQNLNYRVNIQGHDIVIRTINLNQEWHKIHADLLAIIELSTPHLST